MFACHKECRGFAIISSFFIECEFWLVGYFAPDNLLLLELRPVDAVAQVVGSLPFVTTAFYLFIVFVKVLLHSGIVVDFNGCNFLLADTIVGVDEPTVIEVDGIATQISAFQHRTDESFGALSFLVIVANIQNMLALAASDDKHTVAARLDAEIDLHSPLTQLLAASLHFL